MTYIGRSMYTVYDTLISFYGILYPLSASYLYSFSLSDSICISVIGRIRPFARLFLSLSVGLSATLVDLNGACVGLV